MLRADPPLQVAKNSFQLDVGIDLWRSQNSCFERGSSEGVAILRHVEAVDCRVFQFIAFASFNKSFHGIPITFLSNQILLCSVPFHPDRQREGSLYFLLSESAIERFDHPVR